MSQNVIVTGGAGYIGSHVCKALSSAGYCPIAYDSLQAGHTWAVKWGPLIQGDILDPSHLLKTCTDYQPIAIFHLASLIDARKSIFEPEKYFQTNTLGTFHVLEAMAHAKIPYLIFSSSAAVYGNTESFPIQENHFLKPVNPYGSSKLLCERIIENFCSKYSIQYANLRYFNAAGADPEGEIGEAHHPETHLIPLIIQALQGKTSGITIYGNHATEDGSAIRDYVHVSDLATAHVLALHALMKTTTPLTLNLGSNRGYSIKQIIKKLELIAEKTVSVQVAEKQSEPSILIADASKAKEILHWEPKHSDLDTLLQTAWDWHKK